mmetsp:Transcript_19750/g.59654  ORF Transcript_19750/g.59654 Transcript_19750/m.59654 type:complete len:963 (-) Transcript_19750:862-3750(-)
MASNGQNGGPPTDKHPMFNLSDSLNKRNGDDDMDDELDDEVADMPQPIGSGKSYSRMRTLGGTSLRDAFGGSRGSFSHEKKDALTRVESTTGRKANSIRVSQDQFVNALVERTGSSVFATRLVQETQELDVHGRPHNTLEGVADTMLQLENNSLEDNLRITFDLLDTRRDGTISLDVLDEVLKVCFRAKKLRVTDRQVHRVAEAIIADIRRSRTPSAAPSPSPSGKQWQPEDHRLRNSLTFNSQTEQRSVTLEELVQLVQSHLDSLPKHDHHHIHKKDLMFKLRFTAGRFFRWRLLPWYTLFWLGMAGCFFTGYWQNYKRPLASVSGCAYPLAKAFAQVVQPVAFLLMIAVCRRTVTAMRETPLKWILPLDESINFHRLCGYLIFICGAGHSICHIGNYTVWTSGSYADKWDRTFPGVSQFDKGHFWKTQVSITGYIMWAALLIGFPFATYYPKMAKCLQGTAISKVLNNFKYFAVTHFTMWFVFYVALILHPWPGTPSQHFSGRSVTWIYVALPLVIYIVEKLYRFIWPIAVSTELVDVELAPGDKNVTVLRMRRPRGFQYTPGMYTFVNVPDISVTEWHPFTISSAPGDPYVSVHIQAVGDWTKKLHEIMKDYCARIEDQLPKDGRPSMVDGGADKAALLEAKREDSLSAAPRSVSLARVLSTRPTSHRHSGKKSGLDPLNHATTFGPGAQPGMEPTLHRRRTRASLRSFEWGPLPDNPPRVLLDGPYAAPAQHWEDYDILLLVGGSIGVTPFASIMADLVNRLESRPCTACGSENVGCRACDHAGCRLFGDGTGMTVEKVYFHWVVGDHQAPNYIASTLETISKDDQLNLIEPRIHVTSFKPNKKETDLHYVLAKLGQDALHEQRGVDIVTGLQSKVVTEFGRPDWPKILAHIAAENPGQTVGVFFCGAPMLGKTIKDCCYDWNAGSTRRRRVADSTGDVEAQHPVLEKTIFHFYEEFF